MYYFGFTFWVVSSFILFLLVIPNPVAFLLNVTSTVMFWMSACQSILCTVHLTWSLCYPDGLFTVRCCGRVVDRLTSNPWQCSPHDMLTCAYSFEDLFVVRKVCMAFWKTICTNRIPQKTKRTAVNGSSNALLQFFLVTSQCAAMVCSVAFQEYEWCDFF